ncbi:acyl-CoA dehydrogenase family protein [Mycobacterium palustre]|uniref:Acyl-CoA dehydrogenase n=1 Tax=Mycobacterium palustre TaxID=153971 RepID=A0A1X1ZW45_9MYCO|nr:acyl-CoA dehydrogenase family protein [Mycobacterium palustre]MCV7101381.1 acyl-CoA dehydrogenase family protein [Mycobacterium palustre]ORW28282.1 acyl-CoA dehydrogenase [Mycobacterium palustre]
MGQFEILCANDPDLASFRASIRQFLEADREEFGWRPAVDSWLSCWDAEFSSRLGSAGFLGLTVPTVYGGRGLTHMHRYVVTEELLAQGAPVAAHWMADRQVAPALLAYGSDEQRHRLLPQITAGRLSFAIGLSEYGAGSDLAAAQSKATRVAGGWLLNGTKVWTSGAHRADYVVVFARTSPIDPKARHAGFSQFLVPRESQGVVIGPIVTMSGEHHFNEVVLEDVFVPDAGVLGEIGAGWQQVTAELAFERSGPERILTTAPLILAALDAVAVGITNDGVVSEVGDLVARMVSLRQMSVAVARRLVAGESAGVQAALVKDLGTCFEQDSVDQVARLLDGWPTEGALKELCDAAQSHRPMFTLRGGTNEVLRGIVARGIGLR